MTTFLRLLAEPDKAAVLMKSCARVRRGVDEARCYEVAPGAFDGMPGRAFAYWVSDGVRATFRRLRSFESEGRTVKQGLATADDFRFVRAWWEVGASARADKWPPFAKGGAYSPFYADLYLALNWAEKGKELKSFCGSVIRNPNHYLVPGLTWPLRTTSGLSLRVMPAACIFGHKGPAAFVVHDPREQLLALLALSNSNAFNLLVSLQLAAADAAARSYEVGVIQKTPVPDLDAKWRTRLARLACHAWSLKRTLCSTTETSHAFLLPAALRPRLGDYDPPAIEIELARIQAEIDSIAFDLYGFPESDRTAALGEGAVTNRKVDTEDDASDEDVGEAEELAAPSADALLSWAIGVTFGRFDWRLATGERAAPPEPEPFDPLPSKSPGMLPDGEPPFHGYGGVLVDDPGHPHDLVRIAEHVLERVGMPVPGDLRRWLQRDLFPFHLQRYSKSRRKAPIYWPLATESGSYTLWLYYPSLTSQTLYTTVNDFVEPKLKQVSDEASQLRALGGGRSRADEKQLEALHGLESEFRDLRDQLLAIAPRYRPNHDDGVQITAAPLWPLFRHKPWQKELRETWAKLEKGDYDWAHLAMAYWPERVHEKCKTDKSIAIAHGLEDVYVEPPKPPKKKRARKKA